MLYSVTVFRDSLEQDRSYLTGNNVLLSITRVFTRVMHISYVYICAVPVIFCLHDKCNVGNKVPNLWKFSGGKKSYVWKTGFSVF